ncbi:unnamed protein product [Kluyveromyces dobzhanskii CBS 2104]|uniref:WGS project CCBQ000000000 data, contig 00272 n=1 Tax=Kluyveromyces dobzhanskii CBS 2104 TaxID=1427455 RepID=A0A0A8L8T8_9SACH|nr:unnamed protein product [Kluyveromyces dobzhanskii CBS 2104]
MSSNDKTTNDESLDPANDLAEAFKKEGHLDSLKKEILSQNVQDNINLEEFIKSRVRELVSDKVREDESLIFKNRGTTTALLEGQLFKEGFKNINLPTIDAEKLLNDSLNDEALKQKIIAILDSSYGDS